MNVKLISGICFVATGCISGVAIGASCARTQPNGACTTRAPGYDPPGSTCPDEVATDSQKTIVYYATSGSQGVAGEWASCSWQNKKNSSQGCIPFGQVQNYQVWSEHATGNACSSPN